MRKLVFLSTLLLVVLAVLLPCIVYADEYSVYEYKGIIIKVPSGVSVSFDEKDAFTVASFTLPEDAYIYVYPKPLQIYVDNLPHGIRGEEAKGHWLAGWKYRKSHVIHGASGAGVGYQICIKVHYGSGVDSGENVYLDGKCSPDFGDIRFTDDDGVTLLSYWLQEKVDYDYAVFWVKVLDGLSSGIAMIYVYYGNPSATSISDLAGTFVRVIDGLVLALPFDEGSGSVAYDRSGYGNNGTLYNGVTWTSNATYGYALSFNGVNGYVVLPPIPFTGEITIVAWIYDKNVYTYYCGTVFGWYYDESNNFVLNHYSSTGYQKFEFKLNNILRRAQTTTVIPSRWLCVAGVFSASQGFVRLYWDGSLVVQTTFSPFSQQTLTPVRNYIGRYESGHWFEGCIDEVRIYNRALSSAEISDLYAYRPFEVPENAEARGKTILRKYVSPEPSHGGWGTVESVLFSKVYVRAGVVEIYFGKPVAGEPPTGLFQYLQAGDFLGFIMAGWTLLLRQAFWVLPYFIIFVPLYIKTESGEYCAIIFILLSGFFLLFMPAEAGAVAMVFLSLSLGFLLYKLVIKLIHWH